MSADKLNRCKSTPKSTDRAQQGCLDILAKKYEPLGELGRGEFGVTIKLRGKKSGHVMAMKMTVYTEDSAREIGLHCKLNKLYKMTPIFGVTHGWILCDSPPAAWNIPPLKHDPTGRALKLFILNDLNDFVFAKLNPEAFTLDDVKQIFFMLLHGIAVARKHFGYFRHFDIHGGNVMVNYSTKNGNGDKTVTLPAPEVGVPLKEMTTCYNLKKVRFIPKLIDFGLTKLREQPGVPKHHVRIFGQNVPRDPDLHGVQALMQYIAGQNGNAIAQFAASEVYVNAINASSSDYESINKVLKSPFFSTQRIEYLCQDQNPPPNAPVPQKQRRRQKHGQAQPQAQWQAQPRAQWQAQPQAQPQEL